MPGTEQLLKRGARRLADDENDAGDTGAQGLFENELDEPFAVGADPGEPLDAAAETARKTGDHADECYFWHIREPSVIGW